MSAGSSRVLVARGTAIIVISGLAGAALTRLAPGYGLDERVLDARLSPDSIAALRRHQEEDRNPFAFYLRFLRGIAGGDAGRSVVYGEPVNRLIAERAPTTVWTVSAGLVLGWIAAVGMAGASALLDRAPAVLAATAISGSLLSIPSAVLAIICLLFRLPPAAAIAAVILPRVFPHAYGQFRAGLLAPHVVMARARGVGRSRVFLFHVVPPLVMPLLALAGVSITLAFGASIPIEALADSPGLGQLAWSAALGRDLPVLVALTLLLTVVTVTGNVLADLVILKVKDRAA
jgi:peptide/nickel transport system permease protein